MKRVVATGSECTGKTTLAEALATHYDTICVPEYARQFVIEKGAAPEYQDVNIIARGQIALEDEMASRASKVLIQDTDLLSTLVYCRHYYDTVPEWIEDDLCKRAGDLYLLCDIDIPWIPDGDQRDRGDRREEMHDLFRSALVDRKLDFRVIGGRQDERLKSAVSMVGSLLSASL